MATLIPGGAAQRSLAVLREIFGDRLGRDIGVRLWDGTGVAADGAGAFTLEVNTPFALRAALTPPLDRNPGRAFAEGWLSVNGSLEMALDALDRSVGSFKALTIAKLVAHIARLPAPPRADTAPRARLRGRRHSRERDAAAVAFHYNQSLAFYKTFLGSELVYSCAYWDRAASLDEAQRAKLDYVLDKVRLRPGSTFLDIGCGWGGLVIRAAQRGAHAYGITLSQMQHEEAVRRIAELGLGDRARVDLRDYRELGDQRFDAIASVGMVEHVGIARLDEYFACAYRALRDGGLFLNHGITNQGPENKTWQAGGDFIGRYVFPDGELEPIWEVIKSAETAGFEVRDVENLREHYATTLRAWAANLTTHRAAAVAASDERTERIWRIYMTGSARSFALGRMGLLQTLLGKRNAAGVIDVPPTRRDLYANDGAR